MEVEELKERLYFTGTRVSKMAEWLKVGQPTLSIWLNNDKKMPEKRKEQFVKILELLEETVNKIEQI